jgi:hypothetical protein
MFAKAHAGADMLASPRGVGMCAAFWLGDLGVQATRFVVAAGVLGVALSWQDALLVAPGRGAWGTGRIVCWGGRAARRTARRGAGMSHATRSSNLLSRGSTYDAHWARAGQPE